MVSNIYQYTKLLHTIQSICWLNNGLYCDFKANLCCFVSELFSNFDMIETELIIINLIKNRFKFQTTVHERVNLFWIYFISSEFSI